LNSVGLLPTPNDKPFEDSPKAAEEALPSLPHKKTYKTNILEGPMAKSDVGQNLNRFAMKVQEQLQTKELNEPNSTGIISYTSVLEKGRSLPATAAVGSEVKEFFSRKQQLEEVTSNSKSLQEESKSDGDRMLTPVIELQPRAFIDVKPTVISIGKSVESMNKIPLPEPEQERSEVTPRKDSQEEVLQRLSETIGKDMKKQKSNSSLKKSEERLSVKSRSSQERIPQSPVALKDQSKDDEQVMKTSTELSSPIGDVIVPSEEPLSPSGPTHPDSKKDNVKALPSLPVTNLFCRVEKDVGILRCKLIRKKNLMGKGQPTYYLYNELDNSFLLAARRLLMSKSINYVISDHPDDISKDSPHYVAKLKANFMRTNFTLTDTRSPVRHRELACITYSKNVLPRELHVGISAMEIPEDATTGYTTDIQFDFKARNEKMLLFLKNKAPRWNEATQSHCLNFGGRVTQPSIKNMQLICEKTGGGTQC
jgi:hypothetical protein